MYSTQGNTGFGCGMTGYYLHIPNIDFMRLHIVKWSSYVSILESLSTTLHIRIEAVPEALKDNKRRHDLVNISNCFGRFDINCVLCSLVSLCELTM